MSREKRIGKAKGNKEGEEMWNEEREEDREGKRQ